MVGSCSISLPGGDQVDGLLPAASNTKYSCLETPGCSDLFIYFREFFEKILNYFTLATILDNLYPKSMLLLKRMQEDLLLYRHSDGC